jgi:transcriptional repressor NrdR
MVCVHCGQKTQVTNSRLQQRTNQVWRRRACLACRALFSTLETADYSAVWLVKGLNGHVVPFMRDKLLLSLHRSCQHRPAALSDASALTDTVIKKLLTQAKDGVIPVQAIASTVQTALARFDQAASVHYQAFHPA